MDFSVNTKALTGLADMLDRRDHNLLKTADYLQEQSHLAYGPGLLNLLSGAHTQVMKEIDAFLRRAASDYLHQYSFGINQAIEDYNQTDAAANVRVDAVMPERKVHPSGPMHQANPALGPGIFADPQGFNLPQPPDARAQFPYHPSWYDVLSPTTIIRDAIWYLTGFAAKLGLLPRPWDPYEEATEPLCGDWAGLERTSFALGVVAGAVSMTSIRVDYGATTLDQVWTGHAATNCQDALARFAKDIEPAVGIITEIAINYHEVADSAHQHAEGLATLVSAVADIAGSFGGELLVDLIFDSPKLTKALNELEMVIPAIVRAIEEVHLMIEGKQGHLQELASSLGRLANRSIDVNMPDDLPALPAPAHHR